MDSPKAEPMVGSSFTPDSRYVQSVVPSPNFGPRISHPTDILVLHYTAEKTAEEAIARLTDPTSGVSAHYLVAKDGVITQLVREADRAWHAGVSYWTGDTDVNSRSIGIEIDNLGSSLGPPLPPYPHVQIEAVINLSLDIVQRHCIPAQRIVGHSDVAPDRKIDPGAKFPWERLAESGLGIWRPPQPVAQSASSWHADSDRVYSAQQRLLAIGYGIDVNGSAEDKKTIDVVKAFQRRFRTEKIDGVIDRSTYDTIVDIASAYLQPADPAEAIV